MTDTLCHGEPRDGLNLILTTGIKVISQLVPDWQPTVLDHPYAKPYVSAFEMYENIVEGDHIMVRATCGYWHHGIYVGKQPMVNRDGHNVSLHAVVDFWGEDKEHARISLRPYNTFVNGATCWAKAEYPEGAALKHPLSAQLAIAWVSYVEEHPVTYNVALRNCEVFATICRCIRLVHVVECHSALLESLVLMPVLVLKPLYKFSRIN